MTAIRQAFCLRRIGFCNDAGMLLTHKMMGFSLNSMQRLSICQIEKTNSVKIVDLEGKQRVQCGFVCNDDNNG